MPELIGFGLFGTLGIALAVVFAITMLIAIAYRRVVPTNETHILQSGKKTISYGATVAAKDAHLEDAVVAEASNGNTYYLWPTWLPVLGVTRTILPVSVFKLELKDYAAYDKGRLPFVIDIASFFRINDSNTAAARVANFDELQEQLELILQGAVRTILASSDIEDIMQTRATFGEAFTKEVSEQLKHWGVVPVKNMELMDIRDANGSSVIKNIMEKKKSLIESESRQEVAKNQQSAQIAEINAQRETELQKQQAQEQVGLRTAQKDQAVGIAKEQSSQQVLEQARVSKEKEMNVKQVNDVRQSEIDKEVSIVQADKARAVAATKAEQDKQVATVTAEGEKNRAILIAEGQLEAEKRRAEAVLVNGQSHAESERLSQIANIAGQITLAKEIGDNEGYQNYLITIRKVEADQAIGIENAKALTAADIKIISNAGNPVSGVKSVGDLFTSGGGQGIAAALEGLAQTEQGQALINKFLPKSANESAGVKKTATVQQAKTVSTVKRQPE